MSVQGRTPTRRPTRPDRADDRKFTTGLRPPATLPQAPAGRTGWTGGAGALRGGPVRALRRRTERSVSRSMENR